MRVALQLTDRLVLHHTPRWSTSSQSPPCAHASCECTHQWLPPCLSLSSEKLPFPSPLFPFELARACLPAQEQIISLQIRTICCCCCRWCCCWTSCRPPRLLTPHLVLQHALRSDLLQLLGLLVHLLLDGLLQLPLRAEVRFHYRVLLTLFL